jgi:uncharacterized protein YgiM (DUF1202 family)
MSHTNYNGITSKNDNRASNVNAPVQPEPETVEQEAYISGTVFGCMKLNVRKDPNINADILFTIDKDTEVTIDTEESTAEWYKVFVNDQEGFCMKKYISLPQ